MRAAEGVGPYDGVLKMGREPERYQWQMQRGRSVCCGLWATQAFAPRRTQGTANGIATGDKAALAMTREFGGR